MPRYAMGGIDGNCPPDPGLREGLTIVECCAVEQRFTARTGIWISAVGTFLAAASRATAFSLSMATTIVVAGAARVMIYRVGKAI